MARHYLALLFAAGLTLTSVPGYAFTTPVSQPSWAELSTEQREILSPLAKNWDELDAFRRRKWIGIAQRYPHMSAEEKRRIQHRMAQWASLSPEERKLARTKYKNIKKTSPEKKAEVKLKWTEYESLPESERLRLTKEAENKKKTGSGTARSHHPGSPGLPISQLPQHSNKP